VPSGDVDGTGSLSRSGVVVVVVVDETVAKVLLFDVVDEASIVTMSAI